MYEIIFSHQLQTDLFWLQFPKLKFCQLLLLMLMWLSTNRCFEKCLPWCLPNEFTFPTTITWKIPFLSYHYPHFCPFFLLGRFLTQFIHYSGQFQPDFWWLLHSEVPLPLLEAVPEVLYQYFVRLHLEGTKGKNGYESRWLHKILFSCPSFLHHSFCKCHPTQHDRESFTG